MSTGKPSWWGNIGGLLKKNSTAAAWVAVISVLVTSYLDIRKDNRVGFQDVAKEYQQENLRLREVERRCLELEVQLSRQLSQLQNKLVLLESASQDLPFPHWLKSGGTKNNPGIMLALNRSYEAAYLLPIGKTAEDYIGKTDAQFWGEEIGTRYWEETWK